MFVLKLIGAAALLAIALLGIMVWDSGWNGGRLLYRLAGGEALEADCTPPLRDSLIGKGFSPVDLAFGAAPSTAFLSGSFGRERRLSDSFTFSDGQDGPRVDGHVVCRIAGPTIEVEVEVEQLPHRVT